MPQILKIKFGISETSRQLWGKFQQSVSSVVFSVSSVVYSVFGSVIGSVFCSALCLQCGRQEFQLERIVNNVCTYSGYLGKM